jgi:hypothetical protein
MATARQRRQEAAGTEASVARVIVAATYPNESLAL